MWPYILFVLLIGGCLTSEFFSHRRLVPPAEVNTLNEFLRWRPWAAEFAAAEINGEEYVIAYGPMSSWMTLASGPSAYVFNENRELVAWSYDIGDDPEFDEKWNAQLTRGRGQQISREQLMQTAATQPSL